MIPAPSREGYDAAHRRLAVADRGDRAWIVLSGADRRTYLHGLLTNDIATLGAGTGCYSAYLTPQGRMIADLWVYELGDVLLVSASAEVKASLLAKLDQFIFTEDVQLGDVSDTFAASAVLGPDAAGAIAAAAALDQATLHALPLHGNLRATFQGQPAIVLKTADLGVDGYDVLVDANQHDVFRAALMRHGAAALDQAALDALRVEAGIPRFHVDMDEDTIPLEAGIEARAISMTKGCYVGQEVIVRVLHRGHGRVAKKLTGLLFDANAQVENGAKIVSGEREIGRVTSTAWSPALERPVALGYVHRDFLAPGTIVTIAGAQAEVAPLPLVPARI